MPNSAVTTVALVGGGVFLVSRTLDKAGGEVARKVEELNDKFADAMSTPDAPSEYTEFLPTVLHPWDDEFHLYENFYGLPRYSLAAVAMSETAGDYRAVGPDGHGWGLMQLDDRFHAVAREYYEKDDVKAQIRYAGHMILERYNSPEFQESSKATRMKLTFTSYNRDWDKVKREYQAGENPDLRSSGGAYGENTYRRMLNIQGGFHYNSGTKRSDGTYRPIMRMDGTSLNEVEKDVFDRLGEIFT